jgi:hypothetical protein
MPRIGGLRKVKLRGREVLEPFGQQWVRETPLPVCPDVRVRELYGDWRLSGRKTGCSRSPLVLVPAIFAPPFWRSPRHTSAYE